MAMENVQATVLTFQSSGAGCVMPMVWLSGIQNTLRPYAMPMDRWMARAAGGTSQRLKPGPATVRSLESRPAMEAPDVEVDGRIWFAGREGRRATG